MSDGPAGAGWRSDPWRTYELRYFDGVKFTDQVSTGGKVATDPFFDLDAPLPPAGAAAAPTEPVAKAPVRDKRLPWVIGAVIVLALLIVGGIVAATRDDDSDKAPAVSTTTTIEKSTTTTEPRTTTTAEKPTTTAAPPTTTSTGS